MLTSSFLYTAGYAVMAEWIKQHAAGLMIASITGIGTFTAGQVTNEVRMYGVEKDIAIIIKERDARTLKYIPMIEKHDDDIRLLRRDYDELSRIATATAILAQQNAGNISILLEDRKILSHMNTNVQELTVDVGVMKNEVTHIKEKVDRIK